MHERTTGVLPIVGPDVGAIGSIALPALVRAKGTLFNIRINFSSLNNKLRLAGGVFQISHHQQYLQR